MYFLWQPLKTTQMFWWPLKVLCPLLDSPLGWELIIFSAVLGILCSIKRVWVEWNEKELSLDVQEKQWPHLEEVLMPFTSDGNISDAKNIKLEQIEMISRNGFLWNTDVWNVQGRSTRDKLRALLYYQPVLQHRIELYVGCLLYTSPSPRDRG